MATDNTIHGTLIRIFMEAVENNWEELKPLFQGMSYEILRGREQWRYTEPIRSATDKALEEAIKRHTSDTFAPVVDAIAKEKVRQKLAKELKSRGMDTSLLDSIP